MRKAAIDPKRMDQPDALPTGKLTQNGKFKKAIEDFRKGARRPEPVMVYEKIMAGVWSLKGVFDLVKEFPGCVRNYNFFTYYAYAFRLNPQGFSFFLQSPS